MKKNNQFLKQIKNKSCNCMGILRSMPDKQVKCTLQNHSKYSKITAAVCGWQLLMQDFGFSFMYSNQVHVMGILDGNNGPEVAEYCQNQIEQILKQSDLMQLQQYQAAIQSLCFTLDYRIKQHPQQINKIRLKHNLPNLPTSQFSPSGASIIICITTPQSVTIGNLGQCKAYVSYKNSSQQVVLLSGNHLIQKQQEIDEIMKKGGFVVDNLVNGKFLFNKGIGNLRHKDLENQSKSLISSQPSVFSLRPADINAIVMGSSGLWEQPERVLKEVLEEIKNPILMKQHIEDLFNQLVADSVEQETGKQNISIKVVYFNH